MSDLASDSVISSGHKEKAAKEAPPEGSEDQVGKASKKKKDQMTRVFEVGGSRQYRVAGR